MADGPPAQLSIRLCVWTPGEHAGKAGKWAKMKVSPVAWCPNYDTFLGHIINAMGENVPVWVGEARQEGLLYMLSEKPTTGGGSNLCDLTTGSAWPGMFWSRDTSNNDAGFATSELLQHLTTTENNGSDNLWLAKACPVCVEGKFKTLFVLTSLLHAGVCTKQDKAHNEKRAAAEKKKVEEGTSLLPPPDHPFPSATFRNDFAHGDSVQ